MNRFLVIENPTKEHAVELGKFAAGILRNRGAEVIEAVGKIASDEKLSGIEGVITVGGDGTLINAVSAIGARNIPVIGINAGHLGYLASASTEDEIVTMADQLVNNNFTIEERILVKAVWGEDELNEKTAFNEVAIGRSNGFKSCRVKVSVDGEVFSEYEADGILVSTPTGSTAYNLSAGGPIIQSNLSAFVITPLVPHAITTRSLVVSADSKIRIEIMEAESIPIIAFDGKVMGELKQGTIVNVTRSDMVVRMITLNGTSFVKNLRKKLELL